MTKCIYPPFIFPFPFHFTSLRFPLFFPSSCFTIRSRCQAHLSQHVALSSRNSDRFPHHYHPSPFTPSYLIFSLFLSDASFPSIVSLHLTAQSLSNPIVLSQRARVSLPLFSLFIQIRPIASHLISSLVCDNSMHAT